MDAGILNNKKCEAEAAHITEMERKIDDAYRAASTRFKLYFIRQQMDLGNNKTEAFVSRITFKGIKVFIQEFGLYTNIHIKKFDDDYYEVDEHCRYIVGRSNGVKIHCGDKIPLIVEDVNFAKRDVVLRPALDNFTTQKKPSQGKKAKAKKKPSRSISKTSKNKKNASNSKKKVSPTSPKAVFQKQGKSGPSKKNKKKKSSRKKRK